MTASQLIKRLQFLQRRDGDLEVRIYNQLEGEFEAINEVEPRRVMPEQRATDAERAAHFIGIDPYAIGDWRAQLRYDNTEFGTKTTP